MPLNGTAMLKDCVIAEVRNGAIMSINKKLAPFYLRTGTVEGWLRSRAADKRRVNIRLLKKALRLTSADDIEVVLKVNAATITDTYWFKPAGSELRYEDVRFKFNQFDKLALYGDPDSFNSPDSPTPELTNIGSFEKCWRLEDGKWWLYKQGSELERFSEMFAAKLGHRLGFDMAEYRLDDGFIKSRDFTHGAAVNYEAAEGMVGSNDDYALNFDNYYTLSPECARQYLTIIYMDTLVFNMDRHTQNYGILRDVDSGVVLGMAPNFDNNVALIARGYPKDIGRTNDRLVGLFAELLRSDSRAMRLYRELDHPPLTRELIISAAESVPIEVDRGFVTEFVMSGEQRIMEALGLGMEQKQRIDTGLSM